MGFLDKIKKGFRGGKEISNKAKEAAAKVEKSVDDVADKAKEAAAKVEKSVDDVADETKKE